VVEAPEFSGVTQMEISMATTAKPNAAKSKLDEVALRILKNAGDRKDRLVFPLPASMDAPANKVGKKVKDLISRGLIEECLAKLEDSNWRTDEQQRHLTLWVTRAGLDALGGQNNYAAEPSAPPTTRPSNSQAAKTRGSKPSKASPSRQKQATKAERTLALLRRSQGATIAELTKSTGWQAHSIRGFLSGTLRKKMKLKVKSERPEGKERRYKVA
jgi:hypothetical protein